MTRASIDWSVWKVNAARSCSDGGWPTAAGSRQVPATTLLSVPSALVQRKRAVGNGALR